MLIDRLLGPNADRAIVEKLLAVREPGEEPQVPFRLDERVLRPRVAGFIAVGGSLTPQWKALALPAMHILTFSMQTAVVDQFVIARRRHAEVRRAGRRRAEALARPARRATSRPSSAATFDEAEYVGEPGLCPLCHLDVDRAAPAATCSARPAAPPASSTTTSRSSWTDLDTSVVSMAEKRAHYDEILETAQRHAARARHDPREGVDLRLLRPGSSGRAAPPNEQEARQ